MKEGSIWNEGEKQSGYYLETESGREGKPRMSCRSMWSQRQLQPQASPDLGPSKFPLVFLLVWGRFYSLWIRVLTIYTGLSYFEAYKIVTLNTFLLCFSTSVRHNVCSSKNSHYPASLKLRVFDKHIRLFEKCLLSTLSIIDKGLKFHEKNP